VFLVACAGDQRSAAAVLFERESVRRDTPPQREEGEVRFAVEATGSVDGGGSSEGMTVWQPCRDCGIPFTKSRRAQSSTDDETWVPGTVAPTLNCFDQGDTRATVAIATEMRVRRLTPRECERLQGFPDDYTAITFQGRPAADGPRYKAIGNSMAVPVMRWLGERIEAVERSVGRS
jgi:DNA (cytosine-5)-methyltransferase 1